jgi:ribosomal protein S18 acetylase RimI-like enzyme
VNHLLDNPVYHALCTGNKHLGYGSEQAKYFDEAVSPFAGFAEGYAQGFDELYHLLPPARSILYATPQQLENPPGWELRQAIEGLQLVFDAGTAVVPSYPLIPLQQAHIPEMIALARLTQPGPFSTRTIDFGRYYGIFANEQLVAMTGQRLHLPPFAEVSAVCTHPDHLGKGYAAALVQQVVGLILQDGETPFLHVRADNRRAIDLYERLGFSVRGPMNFYVLKRKA